MRIVVIGANGQLGSDICEVLQQGKATVIKLNHDLIDISDLDSVSGNLKESGADLVINTAAMHHVENCENNPELAFKVNGIGAHNLASVCQESGSVLVHISTDYVFNGCKNQPYIESDLPLPLNVYGNTKLSGEHFIQAITDKYYILRVSGIYGKNPCRAKGRNFVQMMLELAQQREELRVVDDEFLTPTFTWDIAEQLNKLILCSGKYGLYHVSAEGSCSWHEFAETIFSISQTKINLQRANPGEFAAKVNRPKYCVLENRFLKEQGLNIMPHWQDGLKRYLLGQDE